MAVDIIVPKDLWEEEVEGVIVAWLTEEGASVRKGDVVAEIMVKKVQFDILAPAEGRVRILKKADEIIRKGDVIGRIE
ncbi:MAG: biotin attachment protein [Acidobacteriia bacterium]|nr:biotin attachment protein [Methyloceanibacter sp.]MBX5470867.1 biotin attachment protein [Acetobacteraceae bacterium]MCL6490572.1 biotin attachment protein [Terriglobia bacterium]